MGSYLFYLRGRKKKEKKRLELKCIYPCHRHKAGIDNCSENSLQPVVQGGRGNIKDGNDSYIVLTWYKSQDPLFGKCTIFAHWPVYHAKKVPLNM